MKDLRARQYPINAAAGEFLKFDQYFDGRRALAKFILRQLRLADAEDLGKLALRQVEAPYLPDSTGYRR